MEKEPRIYKFSHKFHRILCYFSLLMIPLLLIVLIYNFNVLGLFLCTSLSILIVLLCYWCNNLKLILYEDKIILHNFKKHIFLLHEIQRVSLEERGYIKFVYDDKVYLTSGFLCMLFGEINKEKNKELVDLLKKEMKKARIGKSNRSSFKDIEVIAEKRMWTIFLMFIYLLFDMILIVGLITSWNVIVFWMMIILTIIIIPLIIHKIFSPKKVILYDSNNGLLIINKLFKIIELDINDIFDVTIGVASRSTIPIIITKDHKKLHIIGIKKSFDVLKKLREISNT